MSNNLIQQIFYEKLQEIQSRIPVKLNFPQLEQNQFQAVLDQAVGTVSSLSSVSPSAYDSMITNAARRYQLAPELIKAVMKAESGFNPSALSSAGAQGLMQLMPETAQALGVNNVWDPQENINGGAKYLRQMLDRYDGSLPLALAAYNAGPGNVDAYEGIPPFTETQNYVKRVIQYYSDYVAQKQV